MKLGIVLGALVIATAASANAAVVNVTALATNPTANPGTSVTATGYTAYEITVDAGAGNVVTGIGAGGTGTNTNGITGSLLQMATSSFGSDTATPFETDVNNNGPFSADSHFLFNSASVIAIPGSAQEDNNGVNPSGIPTDPSGADFGSGTFLEGTFGLGTAAAQSVNVAYVLLPTGQVGNYEFDATIAPAATPLSGVDSHFSGTIGSAAVPEPASLGIMALGGLALLGRRRRKTA